MIDYKKDGFIGPEELDAAFEAKSLPTCVQLITDCVAIEYEQMHKSKDSTRLWKIISPIFSKYGRAAPTALISDPISEMERAELEKLYAKFMLKKQQAEAYLEHDANP